MDSTDVSESISYKPQHPLPEEIQKMKRDDTICQYCGVSYLIHNEIKKLEEKINSYEKKVNWLFNYLQDKDVYRMLQ